MEAGWRSLFVCACALFVLTTASCENLSKRQATAPNDKHHAWIERLVASQGRESKTVIEAVEYQGREAFHVMPQDRAPDSGNEHILYDVHGNVICEFGGFVGHVARGSCDIEKINYKKTIFPMLP